MSGGIAEVSLQSQENNLLGRLKPYPFLLNQRRGPLAQDASASPVNRTNRNDR